MNDRDCAIGIAIVEDEREIVNIYQIAFARRKLPVCFVAYDGREAVKMFRSASPRPGIILMDHRLPGMTGVEAAKKILDLAPDTKIIFLSADANVKQEALKAGALTFLKKPATLKEVNSAIDNAMKGEPIVA